MIDTLKELFPVEAIGPAIGGALIWFGANYAFVGPELIGPRLKEKHYVPMCEMVVAEGRSIRAREEKALIARAEDELARRADMLRSQLSHGAGSIFSMMGAEGQNFWNKWGNQIGGGVSSMMEGPITMRLEAERAELYAAIRAEKAKAQSSIVHKAPNAYCGCLIDEALDERTDLAFFTSTLRFYTPPTIRNIETGAIFSRPT